MSSLKPEMVELRELELLEPDQLLVVWRDGHESLFPYRFLRLKCSCARCIDEFTGKPLLAAERVPEDIRVRRWEATGRYGINLFFSDGHATGIYTLRNLRRLCPCPECVANPVAGENGEPDSDGECED